MIGHSRLTLRYVHKIQHCRLFGGPQRYITNDGGTLPAGLAVRPIRFWESRNWACWHRGDGEDLRSCGEPPAYSDTCPRYPSFCLSYPSFCLSELPELLSVWATWVSVCLSYPSFCLSELTEFLSELHEFLSVWATGILVWATRISVCLSYRNSCLSCLSFCLSELPEFLSELTTTKTTTKKKADPMPKTSKRQKTPEDLLKKLRDKTVSEIMKHSPGWNVTRKQLKDFLKAYLRDTVESGRGVRV